MIDYTQHTFSATNVDLNYVEFKGDGPTLVVGHGFSSRWQGHMAYIERLPDWHIYAVDHAGHGQSGNRNGTYKLLDFSDDMAEFIENMTDRNVAYIGMSLGALVGMVIAGTKPDLIKTMVLGDAPWSLFAENYMGSWLQKARVETRSQLQEESTVEEQKIKIAAGDPTLTEAQVENRAMAFTQLRSETVDALADGTFPDGWNIEECFKNTKAATLILQGDPENGGFQPDSDVTKMLETYADAEAAKFYGLNHSLDYGIPGAPFAALVDFLGKRHPG
ncbi:MAG: alpha/beta hydrolase [Chloroflexi bacterium]|nr:alpha/beta hydrolase [Chloroflexota bacterium]